MSKWGTIHCIEDYSKHVLPIDERGKPFGKHKPSMDCHCKPKRDDKDPSLIIHNDAERGGYNS